MDNTEARQVLAEHLSRYRARSYSELAVLVESKHVDAFTAKAGSGQEYHLEFVFYWDNKRGGDVGSLVLPAMAAGVVSSRSQMISL
jgi:hypothetical protein